MKREVFSFDAVAPARERGLKSQNLTCIGLLLLVAPARERGLKCLRANISSTGSRRSRKGAWIEIVMRICKKVYPLRRSRKGAWIEIKMLNETQLNLAVAPARERGLKFQSWIICTWTLSSLPQGSVD